MSNEFSRLENDAVVHFIDRNSKMPHKTLKVGEWLSTIPGSCNLPVTLFESGHYAQVLIPGKEWQTGQIRVTLEFCPNKSEVLEAGERIDDWPPRSIN